MVERQVYCRNTGEHSQRQGHLGESRVDVTSRWSWDMWETEREKETGERGTQCSSQEAKDIQGWVTIKSGLCREEPLREGQPSPWAGKFRAEVRVCQPYSITGRY